jgi:hypothetical protein
MQSDLTMPFFPDLEGGPVTAGVGHNEFPGHGFGTIVD